MQRQSAGSQRLSHQFQRTYQACSGCRNRKVKCDIGRDGPPCQRCRRQHKECLFAAGRGITRGQQLREDSAGAFAPSGELQFRLDHDHTAVSEQNLLSEHSDERLSPSISNPRVQINNSGSQSRDLFAVQLVQTVATPQTASGHHHPTQRATPSHDVQQSSHPQPTGPATSVMRTLVTSANDALGILCEAASQDGNSKDTAGDEYSPEQNAVAWGISPPSSDIIKIWRECRFVTMGWVTATDAFTYLDLFFRNMSGLCPILTSYFASYEHHQELLAQEPMLCCTILMISTRYHVLPGLAGLSKGYFLHNRLWKYWQDLVNRVIFGQSKGLEPSLRSLGTIESLLIMTDWHPRSLNFPPEGYGWNIDIIPSAPEIDPFAEEQHRHVNEWLDEIIEPTRRSDRMSWMLLGSALTLAHELGIFDIHPRRIEAVPHRGASGPTDHRRRRIVRVQKLLYVYVHQLASRLGCVPMMAHNLNFIVAGGSGRGTLQGDPEERWDFFMSGWIALTKLVKSISDIFLQSAISTREQMQSGRYISLLDHFRPLLSEWRDRYLDAFTIDTEELYHSILFIEHQYIETLLNSFGIQAIVERNLAGTQAETAFADDRLIALEDMDLEYIQAVISGSCKILEMVPGLARSGSLRFMPVRFYLRVLSASVLLLKALCLGVRKSQLKSSLDIIDRSNQALKSCTLDDMHLAPRYATLLDMHIIKLRRRFILSSKNGEEPRPYSSETSISQSRDVPNSQYLAAEQLDAMESTLDSPFQNLSTDDWLSLPFDPSMAPFDLNGDQGIPGFDESSLNFAWSLPYL